MRRAEERVRDMLLAIEGIEHHTSEGKERFARDDVLQGYVTYQLLVLGEAAYKMPHSLRRQYGGIAEVPHDQSHLARLDDARERRCL